MKIEQLLAPGLALLASSFCLYSSARPFSIDWFKIAGGGGTSANAQLSLTGTLGQHDAIEAMTGGNFSLTGGFWALFSAAQTPGAPPLYLYISHAGSTVAVYWQNVPGWTLQQNNSVNGSGGWSPSSGVTTSNGTNYLNLVSPTGILFFKLTHP